MSQLGASLRKRPSVSLLARAVVAGAAVLVSAGCESVLLDKPTSAQVYEEACRALAENGGGFAAAYMEGAMQGVIDRQGQSWTDPAYDDLRARLRSWEASANPDGAALADCAGSFTWFNVS